MTGCPPAKVGCWHFETCRRAPRISVDQGRPECAGRPARSRWCKSIVEGVANRIDPESCADTREGIGEALTGERIGQQVFRDVKIGLVERERFDDRRVLGEDLPDSAARSPCRSRIEASRR